MIKLPIRKSWRETVFGDHWYGVVASPFKVDGVSSSPITTIHGIRTEFNKIGFGH